MIIKKNINTLKQLTKFATAGTIALAVNLVLLYLLTEKANIYYLLSAAFAFIVSITVSFMVNEKWTFNATHNKKKEYEKYVLVNTLILFGDLIVLSILVDKLKLWYLLAQALAIIPLGTLNFYIQKNWTFK